MSQTEQIERLMLEFKHFEAARTVLEGLTLEHLGGLDYLQRAALANALDIGLDGNVRIGLAHRNSFTAHNFGQRYIAISLFVYGDPELEWMQRDFSSAVNLKPDLDWLREQFERSNEPIFAFARLYFASHADEVEWDSALRSLGSGFGDHPFVLLCEAKRLHYKGNRGSAVNILESYCKNNLGDIYCRKYLATLQLKTLRLRGLSNTLAEIEALNAANQRVLSAYSGDIRAYFEENLRAQKS